MDNLKPGLKTSGLVHSDSILRLHSFAMRKSLSVVACPVVKPLAILLSSSFNLILCDRGRKKEFKAHQITSFESL